MFLLAWTLVVVSVLYLLVCFLGTVAEMPDGWQGGAGINEDELNGYPDDHHPECSVRVIGYGKDPWSCHECHDLRGVHEDYDEAVRLMATDPYAKVEEIVDEFD